MKTTYRALTMTLALAAAFWACGKQEAPAPPAASPIAATAPAKAPAPQAVPAPAKAPASQAVPASAKAPAPQAVPAPAKAKAPKTPAGPAKLPSASGTDVSRTVRTAPRKKRGTYAIFNTSLGRIKARLFTESVPLTCAHFIGLAKGTKQWRDPRNGKEMMAPLYEDVVFHRVVPKFVIQTGDLMGTGRGSIGATVPDEIDPDTSFDRPGLLGIAKSGQANTGSSQFFITVAPTPNLDGMETLFGEVVEGYDVAVAISEVPRDKVDKPIEDVLLKSVEIVEERGK